MKKISVKTNSRIELIDITDEIQAAVAQSKIKDGLCFVFCPHTTAGLTINENADPSVRRDIVNALNKLVPAGAGYAHSEGVIHRDLKPSNVMVDERGVARVTDFGLAEAVAVSGPRAREGTPAYMAPEQLAGREATFASDLYALGLVLYQLFTGRPAYDATTATDLERQRREPPAPPSRLAPGLEEVDRVILDCLALEPGRRPASAHDVAAALGVDEAQARALAAAQQRTDRIEAFRAELAEVRRAGLLHVSEQELAAVETYHERLLSDLVRRFDVDVSERGKQLSLGMRVASIVGAIAMAASVFYFFYSVWGAIPVPLGIAILVTAPVLALLGTDVIARREPAGHFTTMAALLAVACFVTDVVALGSLFSMTSTSMPFLLVGAFALVVAYGYELRLPLVVGLFCLTLFVAGTVHEWAGGLWAYWAARPETLLPAGALLLAGGLLTPRSVHPGFALIYRVLALITLLWPSVLLGQGVDASFLPLAVSTTAVLHQVVGFLLGAGAVWLGVARRQRDLVYGGTFAVVLQLFLRFGYWWWDWMPRYLFFLVVALAALGILLLLRRLRSVVTSVIEEGRP